MPVSATSPIFNSLLAKLPKREQTRFLRLCEPVSLEFGTALCETGEPYEHVYFPLKGFISLVATVSGHHPLEMGMIGSEGMLGVSLVLGVRTAQLPSVVQGAGTALRMRTPEFQQELRSSAALTRILQRYEYVLMSQLFQTAACLHFHELQPRLARWLLMTHDRAHSDHFHLTHDFLANMLGVRRSGVTMAAHALQAEGLIEYARGEIEVLDRPGLEAAACECYAVLIDTYARLFDAPA